MREQHASTSQAIEAALLDYQRAPGRHDVISRKPALLFASMREVLQLASGRGIGQDGGAPDTLVVQAARSFVRAALLYPGATHYAVLGLTTNAQVGEIKERYRVLMRLVHPDFATKGAEWPPDAASRINLANDVLSSPERRAAYDDPMDARSVAAAAPRPGEVGHTKPARPRAPPPPADPRKTLRTLAAGFGSLATLVLVGSWLTAAPERDVLVQKAPSQGGAPAASGPTEAEAPALADASWPPPQSRLAVALRSVLPSLVSAPEAKSPTAIPPPPAPPAPPALASPQPATQAAGTDSTEPLVTPAPLAAAVSTVPAPVAPALPAAPLAPSPAATPVAPTPPVATPVQSAAQAPVATAALAAPRAAAQPLGSRPKLSVAEVQPLLVRLLHQIESGRGDNVIAELDFGTRIGGDAQALSRQIDTMLDGVRPVRIMRTEFKGEPQDGRLTLTGQVTLQVRDPNAPTRVLKLTAEFAEDRGTPVLSRLSATP